MTTTEDIIRIAQKQPWQRLREKELENLHQEFQAEVERISDFMKNLDASRLIAVHLTDHFPWDGTMKPASSGLMIRFSGKRYRDGIIKDMQAPLPRYTIHFALNHCVTSHMGGDWSQRTYAILIPLPALLARTINLSPVDTWIIGNYTLPPGSHILMPDETLHGLETESQTLRNKRTALYVRRSGLATLSTYNRREGIATAVHRTLRSLGYTVISGDKHDWHMLSALNHLREIDDRIQAVGRSRTPRNQIETLHYFLTHQATEKYEDVFRRIMDEFKVLHGGACHAATAFADIETVMIPILGEARRGKRLTIEDADQSLNRLREHRKRLLSTIERIQQLKGEHPDTMAALAQLVALVDKVIAYFEDLVKLPPHEENDRGL
ncbi:MAG: hypothetical protein ABIH41_06700 [Nanoarchaeota archaeon]